MRMIEALQKITIPDSLYGHVPSLWCRPISWRGSGVAIFYKETTKYDSGGWRVPSFNGGAPVLLPSLKECNEEWEVVDPVVVNSEWYSSK